ncbi:Protein of unknown function [Gryllus bimaculatus]|nr:Protein of unknown function [Gryllus bimaculatus]
MIVSKQTNECGDAHLFVVGSAGRRRRQQKAEAREQRVERASVAGGHGCRNHYLRVCLVYEAEKTHMRSPYEDDSTSVSKGYRL